MSTRLTWSRAGLVLRCETSKRPLPRTAWAFALPPFAPVNTVSPGIVTTFVSDNYGLPLSLRVSNLEELPAGYDFTLNWATYEGAAPETLRWNAVQLGPVRGFSQDLALGLAPATMLVYLSRTWSGIREDYVQVTVTCPGIGALLTGATIQNLTTVYKSDRLYLCWDALQIRSIAYEIRKGSTWDAAQTIGVITPNEILAQGDGLYWVSARFDTSVGEPESILVSGSALMQNVVATWDEATTGWSGSMTAHMGVGTGGVLQLAGAGNVDLIPNVDLVPNVDFYGGAVSSGLYEVPAEHVVDIGTAQPCGLSASWVFAAGDLSGNVDLIPNVDLVPNVDGNVTHLAECKVLLAIAQNDGVFGDWQPFVSGVKVGRKFKTGIQLTSLDPSVYPVVSAFQWAVDMPDRSEKFTGLAVGTGGTSQTFGTRFQIHPNPQITIRDAQSGDAWVMDSLTETGWAGHVVNGGSNVARTIDALFIAY